MNEIAKLKLDNTKARLKAYYKAEMAILAGQTYQLGSLKLERADIDIVRKTIKELENEVAILESGGKRKSIRVIPRDL